MDRELQLICLLGTSLSPCAIKSERSQVEDTTKSIKTWGVSSVVQGLRSMCEVLSLIPSSVKTKKEIMIISETHSRDGPYEYFSTVHPAAWPVLCWG